MNKEMKINIMGNPLILTLSNEIPKDSHRIGSVTVDFQNGVTIYVRIYGSVKIFTDGRLRDRFEMELRRYCENPAVLEQLFDYNGSMPKARRFNPSQAQVKQRHWYTGGKPQPLAL